MDFELEDVSVMGAIWAVGMSGQGTGAWVLMDRTLDTWITGHGCISCVAVCRLKADLVLTVVVPFLPLQDVLEALEADGMKPAQH